MADEKQQDPAGEEKKGEVTPYAMELQAMGAVADALNPLDQGARGRLVQWIISRYGLYNGPSFR